MIHYPTGTDTYFDDFGVILAFIQRKLDEDDEEGRAAPYASANCIDPGKSQSPDANDVSKQVNVSGENDERLD